MTGTSVDSYFLEKINATGRLIGTSGGVRWCEKATVESDGLRGSSPISSLYHHERSYFATMLPVSERLVALQASVDALKEHTRCQKMVLGISSQVKRLEVSGEVVNTPHHETSLEHFMNDSSVGPFFPHSMINKESLSTTSALKEEQINTQKMLSERNGLKRLLTEAQNEIDDLRYEHVQQTQRLQKELNEERETVYELRAKERSLLHEAFSAREEVQKLKKDTEFLSDALNKYRVPEQSPLDEVSEKRHISNIKHLEDALTAANKMNDALLENADRQDAMYRSALSEADCLRGKLTDIKATMESERQMYKDRLEEMEREMNALRQFEERLIENKFIEFREQGKEGTTSEDDIGRFHMALTDAKDLLTTLKGRSLLTATIPTYAKSRNVSVQCGSFEDYDNKVNISSPLDKEGAIPDQELVVESCHLEHRCDNYREEVKATKQSHAIEVGLLAEEFINPSSGQLPSPFKLHPAEQVLNASADLSSVNMGVVQENLHLPDNSVRSSHAKSIKCLEVELEEAKKHDNFAREKNANDNSDVDDDGDYDGTSRRNPSAETVVGHSEAELQPPIIVELSTRVKKGCKEDRSLDQTEETIRSDNINSSRCLHCSEVKHGTQTCLWCSNKLNQSLRHLISGTNLFQSSYLQTE